MAALPGLVQHCVSEALCMMGMSWVGGEQPAAPKSSPNFRDPTCRNPPSPEVPRQGNLESKGFRADQHPRENTFGAEQLMPCCLAVLRGSSSCPGPEMSVVVGAAGTSPFLEHTPLFRVLLFCMWSPQPKVPVSPATAWHRNWCLHIFSLFLSFLPLYPNNPGHVSPHPVFPFGFRIVSRHGDEAPSPPHPFCCLVVLYCFRDPLFCFLAFFSSRSFGLFSLTCPRMQEPDFRDADPFRIPLTKDTDPAHPRSYKTCRAEENDSYATEV